MEKNDLIRLEKKYFKSKEEIDAILHNVTLLKWRALTKANKLGKEIWGKEFTVKRLAHDMGVSYSTTKRCLALDNATPKSWELLRAKKISSFKLAMICQLKRSAFQDDIVKAVIDGNMSTCQIKSFNPNSIGDVNKWRHKKAVEKGYSREDAAFRQLNIWVDRGYLFMLMPISSIGTKRKKEMIDKLKLLRLKLDRYIKANE